MMFPTEPIPNEPRVEPTVPSHRVVRRQRDERGKEQRHERSPEREPQPEDDGGEGHVDVRV